MAASLVAAASVSANDLTLKYSQPASRWTEALPVGDGRLGAMIFGSVTNEHLQLNEATLWSGGPRDWNNPGAKEVLPQVRAAIFAGDYCNLILFAFFRSSHILVGQKQKCVSVNKDAVFVIRSR